MKRISKHKASYYERMKKSHAVRSGKARKQPLIIHNAPKRI